MRIKVKLLSVCFLLVLPLVAYSQETGSCAEKLQTAQTLFEKGQVDQVPELLTGCLKTGFNREESLAAYKLLVQAYLLEDKLEKADSVMLAFLKKNPEYEVSPTDHSSFVSLFNNFVSKVVIQVSFHFGSNLPFLFVSEFRQLGGLPSKNKLSPNAINIFFAGEVKYRLSSRIELNGEVGFSQIKFTNSEIINGFAQSQSIESYTRIEVPLSATYDIVRKGKLIPYARLGFGAALNLSPSAKVDYTPLDMIPDEKSQAEISMKSRRIPIDLFLQPGAGIKYKTREGYFFVELRSNLGAFNQEVFDGYGDSDDYAWTYFKGDNSFRLNTLNLTLGYTRIFYKPSKR
jgi:hypothetical protein